jgi:hypothetical protein
MKRKKEFIDDFRVDNGRRHEANGILTDLMLNLNLQIMQMHERAMNLFPFCTT